MKRYAVFIALTKETGELALNPYGVVVAFDIKEARLALGSDSRRNDIPGAPHSFLVVPFRFLPEKVKNLFSAAYTKAIKECSIRLERGDKDSRMDWSVFYLPNYYG